MSTRLRNVGKRPITDPDSSEPAEKARCWSEDGESDYDNEGDDSVSIHAPDADNDANELSLLE